MKSIKYQLINYHPNLADTLVHNKDTPKYKPRMSSRHHRGTRCIQILKRNREKRGRKKRQRQTNSQVVQHVGHVAAVVEGVPVRLLGLLDLALALQHVSKVSPSWQETIGERELRKAFF